MFFESGGQAVHLCHSQASGNPVKIGDGCATVKGYELPLASSRLRVEPLVPQRGIGKAGVRLQTPSQDIGLAVLVMVSSWDRQDARPTWGRLLRQREG
jgi:hypothetical protein